MRRILGWAVVLATAIVASAALAPGAQAVTWHATNDSTFTATSLSTWMTGTANVTILCNGGGTATGTVGSSPHVGLTWTAFTGTLVYSGCTLSGQNVGLHCGYAFTAVSQSGAETDGVYDLLCGLYLANVKICVIGGSFLGSYTNRTLAVSAALDFWTNTGLAAFNGAANCPLGNGDALHTRATTFRISNSSGPVITRTA